MEFRIPKIKLPKFPKNDDRQFIGIAGFTAYVSISETTNFSSTAPDFVCEDLSVVQETIFNAPRTFTLNGDIADIHIDTQPTETFFTPLEKTFGIVSQYLPDRTISQVQKIQNIADDVNNTINEFNESVGDVNSILDIFGNTASDSNNQQDFYNKMLSIYKSKVPVSIELGRELIEFCVIESFSLTETNDGDSGDFSLSIKEVRVLNANLFINNDPNITDAQKAKKKVDPEVAKQTDALTDKGITEGVTVNTNKTNELLAGIA